MSEQSEIHDRLSEIFSDQTNLRQTTIERDNARQFDDSYDLEFPLSSLNDTGDDSLVRTMAEDALPQIIFESHTELKSTIQPFSLEVFANAIVRETGVTSIAEYPCRIFEITGKTKQDSIYFAILYKIDKFSQDREPVPFEGYVISKSKTGGGNRYKELIYTYNEQTNAMEPKRDESEIEKDISDHAILDTNNKQAMAAKYQEIRELENETHISALNILHQSIEEMKNKNRSTPFSITLSQYATIYDGVKNNKPLVPDPNETDRDKTKMLEELSKAIEPFNIALSELIETRDDDETQRIIIRLTGWSVWPIPKEPSNPWLSFDTNKRLSTVTDPHAMMQRLTDINGLGSKKTIAILEKICNFIKLQ